MRFITSQPSQIARLADLIDRNVESNIEILQESMYPLLAFPYASRSQVSGGQLNDSAQLSTQETVANAAASFQARFILSKGLWRITGTVTYQANFTAVANDGFRLEINEPVSFAVVATMARTAPLTQTQTVSFDVILSLDSSDKTLQTVLGATGIGQSHTYVLSFNVLKYF